MMVFLGKSLASVQSVPNCISLLIISHTLGDWLLLSAKGTKAQSEEFNCK